MNTQEKKSACIKVSMQKLANKNVQHSSSNYIISVRNITKRFPGMLALDNCQLNLFPGEVLALMGENGAGKSTLMKILSGVYQKDAGQIVIDGCEVDIDCPRSARLLGISMIHQELNLMNHLSVAQNMYIGREPRGKFGIFLDEDLLNYQASQVFKRMRLNLDPRILVGSLTVAKQQIVEIAKALSFNSRILIMDEPTAALNNTEIDELFRIIRELQTQGVGIIYISHKMDELRRISNRVTILRDGKYIDTVLTHSTSNDNIITMMVGRKLGGSMKKVQKTVFNSIVLEVRGLNRSGCIKDVSFSLHKGEILGFAGLMGAGRTEVARAIFGADPFDTGEILVKSSKAVIKSPADAVAHGIGYLSEDRKHFGLAIGLDVKTNIVMAHMNHFIKKGVFLDQNAVRTIAEHYVHQLSIKTPSIDQPARFLSGGNQQKIAIAKWLLRDCDILFFDEPTRGIDISAKNEIYELLHTLASQGKAIVMISSELQEVLRMSHRVLVMCEGRITGELNAAEASQEKIMQLATQRQSSII